MAILGYNKACFSTFFKTSKGGEPMRKKSYLENDGGSFVISGKFFTGQDLQATLFKGTAVRQVELAIMRPEGTKGDFDRMVEMLESKRKWEKVDMTTTAVTFNGKFPDVLTAIGSLRHIGFSVTQAN